MEDLEGARKTVPPEKNGAFYVMHVGQMLGDDKINDTADSRHIPVPYPMHSRLTREQRKHIGQVLKTHAAAVVQARKLAQFPEGRYRITVDRVTIDTKLPHLQCRNVAALLFFDALRHAELGEPEKCMTSVKAIIFLSRYVRDEYSSIAQLVRIAVLSYALSALEYGLTMEQSASDATLAEIQRLLLDDGSFPGLMHCYIRAVTTPIKALFPAASKINRAVIRRQCELRAAAAALQMERDRLRTGHWADDSGPDWPLDAWAGLPFKLGKPAEGRSVYCLIQATDLQGDFDSLNPANSDGNFGFRLLYPERRR
jgi:hypothetical protein